ncbi:hypothetical protein HYH03_016605 [Edaphochlamys debaryana]|uniref:Senescence domain-containing protein n=1 Tax=Edaphochlamys debaryana TaxID=47281 RepID=A0A835XHB0_9CHLO|nr:hypothetical protein HYH03_016605 [Edaphochlamys debaryana]|eukprot:KAG2484652.1 hypothetical protein HYH03_016605 [Edaphochlamys debaryana]
MQRGADAAVARMAPAGEGARQVSPETQARLEQARSFAAKAAEVSGRAVHGALSVTAQVAGSLAQRISSTDFGRQLSRGHVAGASTQDIRKVGVAGVEAMEALYDSLADAARLVLAHSHAATTQVVGHKYGPSAAQATGAGLAVAQSAAQAGLNVYKLRPTALVRKMVKGTAKEVALGSAGASRSGSEASLPTAGGPGPGPAPSAASAPAAAGGMVLPAGGPAAAAAMLAAVTAPPPGVAPGPPVTAPLPSLVAGGGGPYPVVGPGPGPSVIPPPPTGPPAGPTQGQQPVQMTALPAGCVADGVEVVGPVPAHPVPRPGPPGAGPPLVVADYTPAAAALGGAGGPGAGGTGIGGSAGLPYPAVSEAQYGARYYPAVPGR